MSKTANDKARSVDRVTTRNISTVRDRCTHKTRWAIFKFRDEDGLVEKLLKKASRKNMSLTCFRIGYWKFRGLWGILMLKETCA